MITELIKYFEKHISLDTEEKGFLVEHIKIKKAKKNDLLLVEGQVSKAFYFILKGSVRLFYQKDASERTAFFYTEHMFVSSYESFTKQTPSKHNLQVIEDSVLAVIGYETALKLLEQFPKFEFLARVIMEEELIVYQDIISSFITLNAEERYLKLLSSNSDFLQRVPQHQIATYLGVTAETLSRIRKRLISKGIS